MNLSAGRFALMPLLPVERDRRSDWLMLAALALAGITALLGWPLLGGGAEGFAAVLALAAAIVVASLVLLRLRAGAGAAPPLDWSLLAAIAIDGRDAIAVTDRGGAPISVNPAFEHLFGGPLAPGALPFAAPDAARIEEAARMALREGEARADGLAFDGRIYAATVRRAGRRDDHLVWRFRSADAESPLALARQAVEGAAGDRLGGAGLMMVLADPDGRVIASNGVFAYRALGEAGRPVAGTDLADLLRTSEDGSVRLVRDDEEVPPLRVIPVPVGDDEGHGPAVFLLLDEDPDTLSAAAARSAATIHLHGLLAMLPLGLALLDRDGRFLFMNEAFGRAAGLAAEEVAVYPSDLVCEDDKPIVSDAVRRFAAGRALPGDLAIRLKNKPEEPVALTIANAKGLGDAVVLLSLKDNSEESKLKRQVAQATKMQAVGQLAGGVAHDFNNILTAIIGHCDLMLMRHTPGDIDYDDIQQIKHNSNRAAALTRQLLAFSRQQTLRPQVLQLPDIISEVSNLLRRLLGETVKLEVKHGRNLGPVRADPGQLEQVIVNLAVNARDAMAQGGVLTLETLAVSSAEVRRMRSDIMAVQDYTALRVSDTGCGIAAENLAKVFEPFFTTKEVGKGTGLGLSTVYGIVKQTDGFIFADSEIGRGTSFIIYLPVHHMAASEPVPVAAPRLDAPAKETWGTGTILLVEDEAMVRAVAERALSRQGYTVLTATNGEEALELLQNGEAPDLLISDVVMPTMDGPTLVRAARARFPDLRILFMSGYAEEQLRNSIDIDRVAFLPKPFSVQQLAQAAHDVMLPKAA